MPRENFSSQIFDKIDQIVSEFESEWEGWSGGATPRVGDYLDDSGDEGDDLLFALLKADLEYRHEKGQEIPVEDYLTRYPALDRERAAELRSRDSRMRRRRVKRTPKSSNATVKMDEIEPSDSGSGRAPADPSKFPSQFRPVRKLGAGGMGEVWLVRQVHIGDLRAVKLILPQYAKDPVLWGRMVREARAMRKLEGNPHVVRVLDTAEEPVPHIVMDYVEGTPLDALLKHGEPMALNWTARVLRQLCDAVQAAHDLDPPIVHRDLKPSNLMLVDGKPPGQELLKVLDFGIAKYGDAEINTLTGSSETLGTLLYMSPEQCRDSHGVDCRSDIYTIGVILFEMLTGTRLIGTGGRSSGLAEILTAILTVPAPRFKERHPGTRVPREVENLVLSCLEKDPGRRPRSARALADEFCRLTLPPPASPHTQSPQELPRLSRRVVLASAALTLTGAALAGGIRIRSRKARLLVSLPAPWRARGDSEFIPAGEGYAYPKLIERQTPGGRLVVAGLVPTDARGGAFYAMSEPVSVELFGEFADLEKDGDEWKSGAPSAPVRNVAGDRAREFASWLGAALPTTDQLARVQTPVISTNRSDDDLYVWSGSVLNGMGYAIAPGRDAIAYRFDDKSEKIGIRLVIEPGRPG